MNFTFFVYSNSLTDPDSKISIFGNEFHGKQPCIEKMLSIINKKTAEVVNNEDNVQVNITRNNNKIIVNFGAGDRVFNIVEILYLINTDNTSINADKRALKQEYVKSIRKFAKVNKSSNLIKKRIFCKIDNIGEHDEEIHKIIKIIANNDNTMVLSQDKRTEVFYISYLENWSYDMLSHLMTLLRL